MNYNGYKSFTITTKSGKTITAEVEVSMTYDPCSGADADGNRGVGEWFFDELGLTVPITGSEWNNDDNGNILTQEEKVEAEELLCNKASEDDWDERYRRRIDPTE